MASSGAQGNPGGRAPWLGPGNCCSSAAVCTETSATSPARSEFHQLLSLLLPVCLSSSQAPPTDRRYRAALATAIEPCGASFRRLISAALATESRMLRAAVVRVLARAAGELGGVGGRPSCGRICEADRAAGPTPCLLPCGTLFQLPGYPRWDCCGAVSTSIYPSLWCCPRPGWRHGPLPGGPAAGGAGRGGRVAGAGARRPQAAGGKGGRGGRGEMSIAGQGGGSTWPDQAPVAALAPHSMQSTHPSLPGRSSCPCCTVRPLKPPCWQHPSRPSWHGC